MEKHNFDDTISVTILNKLSELYNNLECFHEFDNIIEELRVLYKEYPKYFSTKTIKKINSYKESSIILRNKKPLPYIDYSNERVSTYKIFNKVKRK